MQNEIATQIDVDAINLLMLQTLAYYISNFVTDDLTGDTLLTYTNDVIYNTNALATFNKTRNMQELHDAIMLQDTLPREEFYKTLQYLQTDPDGE